MILRKKKERFLMEPETSPTRAAHFKEARRVRPLEVAEDYTELIDDLIREQGKARVCDLSKILGVSHVSVLKAVNRLIRDGYLIKNAALSIELTKKGKQTALFSKKKHLVLSEFLKGSVFPMRLPRSMSRGSNTISAKPL